MANKQVIRLTESDLCKIIKESVNRILTEESYRKAAKQGDNTSVANKKELKRKKRDGYKNASKDFHKFAKKHNLDKMKSGASAVCNWEDGCDDNGKYVANENLSKLDFGRVLKEGNEGVITIGSSEYGERGFRVELSDGGLSVKQFNVYAYDEQDALDTAVDYAEKKGWQFLFWDGDESAEEYPDDFITAGNHSHQLRSDSFIVRPLNESYRRRGR